jgi:hypothetical protein
MILRAVARRLTDNKGILSPLGITMPRIFRNPETPRYYEIGMPYGKKQMGTDSFIADTGAYVAYSGAHTHPCKSVKVV